MEGGATRAAAVATWALVCTQGDVLVGVAALRSRASRCFLMRSHLAESVSMLVGVTLLSTLGTDGRASMERVILLLSSVWVAGTLGGVCTLGTRGNGYIVLHAVCPACRSDTFCSVLPFCIRQNVLTMNASISPFISN